VEAKQMLDKFKTLSDQVTKSEEKLHQTHERSMAFEKENQALKSRVASL